MLFVADGADEEAIKSVVSQTVEKFGKLGQASYAAAKEGIRGLSRVAASEWGPYEVRVNVGGRRNILNCTKRLYMGSLWEILQIRRMISEEYAYSLLLRTHTLSQVRQ